MGWRLETCENCGELVSYSGPLDSVPARCFKCPDTPN